MEQKRNSTKKKKKKEEREREREREREESEKGRRREGTDPATSLISTAMETGVFSSVDAESGTALGATGGAALVVVVGADGGGTQR